MFIPSPREPFAEPMRATAVDGEVVVIGDGIAASFTPEAVLASLDQLREAALEAIKLRNQEQASTEAELGSRYVVLQEQDPERPRAGGSR